VIFLCFFFFSNVCDFSLFFLVDGRFDGPRHNGNFVELGACSSSSSARARPPTLSALGPEKPASGGCWKKEGIALVACGWHPRVGAAAACGARGVREAIGVKEQRSEFTPSWPPRPSTHPRSWTQPGPARHRHHRPQQRRRPCQPKRRTTGRSSSGQPGCRGPAE